MVVSTRILALSLFSSLVLATPLSVSNHYSRDLIVHETRDALPSGFSLTGPAPADTTLKLRIALAQKTPDAVVDALLSVSDPTSDKYGQHLSKNEAAQLAAPNPESVSAVNAWLSEHGLNATSITPAGDWLELHVNVSKANTLLGANFSVFHHGSTGQAAIRTLAYSIPASLKGHIDLVHPTTTFPEPVDSNLQLGKRAIHKPILPRTLSSNCANGTTPACLQELYNIPTTPASVPSNKLAVTGRFGNNAHYAFLQEFLKQYRPDMDPSTNFTVTLLDDGNNDQDQPSVSEGELDIQYTVGLATNVSVDYVMVGIKWQDGALEGYLDEVNYLLSLDNPPQVLTTSYGMPEDSLPFNLTDKLCKAYAQLGARGVSILYAAGDSGVGCEQNSTSFVPTFPSNCPYAPTYQADAVTGYLTQLSSSTQANSTLGRFNATGRGFPDVSAKADSFLVWENGTASLFGTSAASPTFASVIALLNDRLAQKGQSPLGFLNPWLYSKAAGALNDITEGKSNIECNGDNVGFEAVKGWDPVTGLGTPDFNKLLGVLGL
ncbi:family S53 protease-like protein [Trametes coccinea BRFM310]|uniref:tripeptidyl-peptidase II n=1 Tax=Trametes coccinea (strain BRFM310) TaxID=1353009 RepID=A0A1Y2J2V7_TRAC3|nr:family S53 protease-like protein [Trametes coccinea BRFM310]